MSAGFERWHKPSRWVVMGNDRSAARPAELLVAADEIGRRVTAVQLPTTEWPAEGQMTLVLTAP